MSRSSFVLLLTFVAAFAGACSTSTPTDLAMKAASDVPAAFLVLDDGELREARPGEGCRNPLVDPRDDFRMTLRRSSDGKGDYIVSGGRYGVGKDELLRVDCATGAPLGVVPH